MPIVRGVGTNETVEPLAIAGVLEDSATLAERVLLRVEELELLVTGDRPRRLIELAQGELADAVNEAGRFWQHQEGLAMAAVSSADDDVQQAWQELRALLAHSARRAAEASSVIAARLAVGEDALAALGLHREYTNDGTLRSGEGSLAKAPKVMA